MHGGVRDPAQMLQQSEMLRIGKSRRDVRRTMLAKKQALSVKDIKDEISAGFSGRLGQFEALAADPAVTSNLVHAFGMGTQPDVPVTVIPRRPLSFIAMPILCWKGGCCPDALPIPRQTSPDQVQAGALR